VIGRGLHDRRLYNRQRQLCLHIKSRPLRTTLEGKTRVPSAVCSPWIMVFLPCRSGISVTSANSQDFANEYVQEQGIMDLDSTNDHLNGPLTPTSPGVDKDDSIRMTVDSDEKAKFAGGVRDLTPHEGSDDERIIPADDCTSPSTFILVEAMKAHVLEPPGDLQVIQEGYNTWEITNYPRLAHRNLGPEFQVGDYKWFVNRLS
jgi:hypothetical protein